MVEQFCVGRARKRDSIEHCADRFFAFRARWTPTEDSIAVGDEFFGAVGLELHGVDAGVGERIDRLVGHRNIAVVVRADLGDHERRGVTPNRSVSDRDVCAH
ncbi:MAG: hypothetical protein EBX39_14400 [Actinobacteria bacterium]|nr:hypothetical protein [Actinomycetota bacterium]